MRLVFLFFLLMNVIFFAWQYTQPFTTEQALPAVDPGHTKLMLAGEGSLEGPAKNPEPIVLHVMKKREKLVEAIIPQPDKPATIIPKSRKKAGNQCYAIGIFAKEKDANAIAVRLKKTGRPARSKAFRGATNLYWVYLPAYESLKKANQAADDLQQRGLNDYQVLAVAGKVNAISLGIFRFRSTAQLRVKHLNRLGYKPKIEIKKRKTTQYKVIYPVKSGQPLSNVEWRDIQAKHPDLVMREEPCK